MDTAQVNGVVTLSNGVETDSNGLSNGSDLEERSHKWVNDVTRKGINKEEILHGYKQWTSHSDYETDLNAVGHKAPALAVKRFTESFPAERRSTVRILDVGAGTGLVGRGLREQGFCHIDALDPSEAMLAVAKKENVYDNFVNEFLTEKQLPIPADTYDGITASGCFIEGHIPCVALYELIRIAKPGGIILIVTRYEYLETVEEYRGTLEPLMDKLVQEGKWRNLARIIEPYYYQEKEGITWKFQVL